MKIFHLFPVRTSTNEPTCLRSELSLEHQFVFSWCDEKCTINLDFNTCKGPTYRQAFFPWTHSLDAHCKISENNADKDNNDN